MGQPRRAIRCPNEQEHLRGIELHFLLSSRSPRTRRSFAPHKHMTRIQSLLMRSREARISVQRNVVRWLVALVGRWEWQAPAWLPWVGRRSVRGWRRATATRARAATLAAAVLAIAAASVWWFTRPTPHYVTYSVSPPGLTEYDDDGISSIKPLSIVLQRIGRAIGASRRRSRAGIDDVPIHARACGSGPATRNLQFTPKDDWPVDGAFSVQLSRNGFFADQSHARETTDSQSAASPSRSPSPRASSIRIPATRT